MCNELHAESFAFDCSEIEPAVVAHKGYDGFELAFDKGFVVADNSDADGGDKLAVIVVDLRNGDIESALQPADYAFDNAALFFERFDTVEVQISCHHADYHKQSSVVQADAVENLLLFELQLSGFVLHVGRRLIQPIGDFPGRGFPVVSSQKP